MRLVLDLDETLLRSRIDGVHKNRRIARVDFSVMIDVQKASLECGISLRPGLAEFMDWMKERRQEGIIEGPWLFTTGADEYISAVLQHLDPEGQVFGPRVLTKAACTTTSYPGFYFKDLTRVFSDEGGDLHARDLRRTLLVDNNPISCVLQPDNGILLRDWMGADTPDDELVRISRFLDALSQRAHQVARDGAQDAGDYTSHVVAVEPNRERLHQQLKLLEERLSAGLPENMSVREALINAWQECCNIKTQHIGGT